MPLRRHLTPRPRQKTQLETNPLAEAELTEAEMNSKRTALVLIALFIVVAIACSGPARFGGSGEGADKPQVADEVPSPSEPERRCGAAVCDGPENIQPTDQFVFTLDYHVPQACYTNDYAATGIFEIFVVPLVVSH
jgi:hypothetical protein